MRLVSKLINFLFKNPRKKKLIDFFTQLQIALEILLHVVLFAVLVILIMYISPLATMFSDYSLETHQDMLATLIKMNMGKWPLFILIAMIVSLVSVLFSHRICGPAYRIKSIIEKYALRDYRPSTNLRKHDYLHDLVDSLITLKGTIGNDVKTMREKVFELKKHIESIADENQKKKLFELSEELESVLSSYKLDN